VLFWASYSGDRWLESGSWLLGAGATSGEDRRRGHGASFGALGAIGGIRRPGWVLIGAPSCWQCSLGWGIYLDCRCHRCCLASLLPCPSRAEESVGAAGIPCKKPSMKFAVLSSSRRGVWCAVWGPDWPYGSSPPCRRRDAAGGAARAAALWGRWGATVDAGINSRDLIWVPVRDDATVAVRSGSGAWKTVWTF